MLPTSQGRLDDGRKPRDLVPSRPQASYGEAPPKRSVRFRKHTLTTYSTLQTCSQPRTRRRTDALGSSAPPEFLFAPADTPPAYTPEQSTPISPQIPNVKSNSTSLLNAHPASNPYARRLSAQIYSESEDDRGDEDEGLVRTAWSANATSSSGLRARMFGIGASVRRERPKTICTTPGRGGAGETETEMDEPPRHLPTARIIPSSGPLVPPNTLEERLTPLLFEFSRLLSIVPAVFGTLYNLYHLYKPPSGPRAPERVDFAVSALWAILTGYQCLCLTTGLLTRWRLYYPPLPTLIRLLALQGICWPATQLTCTILEHQKRPVVVWAVIGTTTCISRGVQIWVTSNLWWETREVRDRDREKREGEKRSRSGYWKRWSGGTWGGRRWDWKVVGVQCILPAGIVYFIMAWAEQLRREFL